MTRSYNKKLTCHTGIGVALSLVLAACGGGGGGGTDTVTPVPTTTLSLTGVAAKGAAIASGAVAVTCAAGSGSATTNANGSFSVTVSSGALPCVVKVTAADGTVLHSVAQGSGSSATVNVSPLTELIVAQAAGGTAASLYANFNAAAQAKVSAAALTTATAAVATALNSVVDLTGTDPIKDTIVAGSGTGLDGKLDALAAKLAAASLTLADVSAAIVANGAAAATVISTQVQPAAASCASARSGVYRFIDPNEADPARRMKKMTFDAIALTLTSDGVVSNPATPVAGKPCQFSSNGGATSSVVSPAGVIVWRDPDQIGLARMAIGFPEQTIPLADLAGTWNSLEMKKGATYENGYSVVTLNAAGAVTSGTNCAQLQPCAPWSSVPGAFSVNTDGGYIYTDSNDNAGFFAYRAPSGDLMLIGGGNIGELIVLGKQRTLTLPTVGNTTTSWGMTLNNQRVAGPLGDSVVSTIVSVNTAANTFTNTNADGTLQQTFAINTPRAGMRYRAANTCTNGVTGAAVNCTGAISLPLAGMGLSVAGSAVAGTDFFGISVTKPTGGSSGSGGSGTTPANTFVVTGGESYPLRVSLTIDAAGQITGGSYDSHKLDGTMTPCEHSAANDATCHGASSTFGTVSQGGPLSISGSAGTITLSTAPDQYGYAYTGTITGTTWSGTWTKVATAASSYVTGPGTFSVVVVISQAG
jgi:hypothetical protein